MRIRNPKAAARKRVSDRLRKFVASLMKQFTTSANDLLTRSEKKLADTSVESRPSQ